MPTSSVDSMLRHQQRELIHARGRRLSDRLDDYRYLRRPGKGRSHKTTGSRQHQHLSTSGDGGPPFRTTSDRTLRCYDTPSELHKISTSVRLIV